LIYEDQPLLKTKTAKEDYDYEKPVSTHRWNILIHGELFTEGKCTES
jgi:hypothetical protein